MVAHRLSTIRKADQIIVMQGGGVVEIGNHQKLMERKGRYFQLVQSQIAGIEGLESLVNTPMIPS